MRPRILSLSYDGSLLETRRMLLERAGYAVTSAQRLADALNACDTASYDLVIVGHSIPRGDKRELVAELRKRGCTAPVLSLLRADEEPIDEAAAAIDPDPQHVLDTVERMVR